MPTAPQQIPSEQSGPSWDDFMSFMRNYTQSEAGGIGNPAGGLEAFFAMLFGSGGDSFVLDPYFMSGGADLTDHTKQIDAIGSSLGKAIKAQRDKKQAQKETKALGDQPFHTTPPPSTMPSVIPPAQPGQRPFPQSPQMFQRSMVQDQPPEMWSMPDQNLLRRWY